MPHTASPILTWTVQEGVKSERDDGMAKTKKKKMASSFLSDKEPR